MITPDHNIERADDIVAREVGGEIVLLDLEEGAYYGLNAVGGRIWELLEHGPRSLAQLCDLLEQEFDVARAALEADVTALAADLQANGLVRVTGG